MDVGKLLIDISVFGFFYFIALLAYDHFFGEKLQLERSSAKQVVNKKRGSST
ncbi:hypothetical protein PPEP_b1119 [Pseudoalteromonas peptidolytica F12-50-A1]|uniref:Uncharacterized protein n=1 Tax=Pseudoalteromonas peptidolytica F12-50-A1 TaxID=1315280 RepID=A0A8I0N1M7_9GAMM|nr:hypothetical protein [Pseudoalteromonas peptidolytica F12-50-A1]